MQYVPYSRITYVSDGTAKEFSIPFPYLTLSTLTVVRGGLVQLYSYQYSVDTTTKRIVFPSPLPEGMTLKIQRRTPRETAKRQVVFQDGGALPDELLNNSALQLLFIIQEVLDDVAEGVNVGSAGNAGYIPDDIYSAINNLTSQLLQEHEARIAELATTLATINSTVEAERNARIQAIIDALDDIDTIISTRIEEGFTPGGAFATRIDTLAAQVNDEVSDRIAAVATETQARITANSALASQITDVVARVDDTEAAITQEATARATADTANATLITQLQAEVDGDQATFVSRVQTEVAAGVAASSVITGLSSRVTTAEANIATEQSTRVSENTALANDLSVISASVNNPTTGLANAHARVTSEGVARVASDNALAANISTLTADVASAHSRVDTVEVAFVNADTALSGRVGTIESQVQTPTTGLLARMYTAEQAIASGQDNTALASRVTTLEATVNDTSTGVASAHSRVTNEQTARAQGDSDNATAINATASTLTALTSTVNDPTTGLAAAHAAVSSEATTRANADSAFANQITTVSATLTADATTKANAAQAAAIAAASSDATTKSAAAQAAAAADATTKAAAAQTAAQAYALAKADLAAITASAYADGIVDAEEARAIADATAKAATAKAEAISAAAADATAKANAAQSQAETYALARANDAQAAAASFTTASVQTEADARAFADGSLAAEYVVEVNAGGVISGFRITSLGGSAAPRSDFAVQAEKFTISSADGTINQVVFRVEGGVIYANEAIIKQIGVEKLIGGTITAQEIILDGSSSIIRSSNFVTGVSGWRIDGDGNGELNSLIVRTDMIEQGAITDSESARDESVSTGHYPDTIVGFTLAAESRALIFYSGKYGQQAMGDWHVDLDGSTIRTGPGTNLASYSGSVIQLLSAGYHTVRVETVSRCSGTNPGYAEVSVFIFKR